MIGTSFERMNGTDTVENGFRFFRGTLENGIRFVTVESQYLDMTEEPGEPEGLVLHALEPSGTGCRMAIHVGLESGSSGELESTIRLSAKAMGVHIRGVCETNVDHAEVFDDGVVYVSSAALGSVDKAVIEKEATKILEQLERYAQEKS